MLGHERFVPMRLGVGLVLLALAACADPRSVGGPASGTSVIPDLTGKWLGPSTDETGSGQLFVDLRQEGRSVAGRLIWVMGTAKYMGDATGRISGDDLAGTLTGEEAASRCRIRVGYTGRLDYESPTFGPGGRIVATYGGQHTCLGPVRNGQFVLDFRHP